jgi:hypothetical protein
MNVRILPGFFQPFSKEGFVTLLLLMRYKVFTNSIRTFQDAKDDPKKAHKANPHQVWAAFFPRLEVNRPRLGHEP